MGRGTVQATNVVIDMTALLLIYALALGFCQVNALHLKCLSVSDVEILLCPRTPEEKQLWMEKMLIAGYGRQAGNYGNL